MGESASRLRYAPFCLGLLGNPGLILIVAAIVVRNLDQLEAIMRFAILSMALNGIGLVAAIIICLKTKPPTDADKLGLVVNGITGAMWLTLWALAFYFGPQGKVIL